MVMFLYLSSTIIAISLTQYLKPQLILLLKNKGMMVKNYSGKEIVSGAGLIFIIPCALSVFPLWKVVGYKNIFIYIALLFTMVLVGYLDDSLGEDKTKGFKGHIRGVFRGNISTGIIKMVLTLIIGFMLSRAYFSRLTDIILSTILFCLCVNFINLLDLRPGRATKGFILFTVSVLLSSGLENIWIILPIISSLAIYIKEELHEIYMLGDTGSNLIGGILGLYIIKSASFGLRCTLIVILSLLHIVSEFRSFSVIIESVPLLKLADNFGQMRKGRS